MERVGYFLPTENEPRVRRARNAVTAVIGLLLLLATASNTIRTAALQDSIGAVIDQLPEWVDVVFWIGYGAAGFYAVGLVIAFVVRAGRNPGAARDVLVSAAVTTVLALVLMRWRTGAWPALLPEFGIEDPVQQFPIVRVAIATAVVLAAAPHVAAALRRFGTAMVLLVAISGFGLGFGVPTDAVAGVGLGMLVGGSVLLIFGTPGGYPPAEVVVAALEGLGVSVDELRLATDQSWGTRRFLGRDDAGNPIEVKAYGKDAVDTQVASQLWRALWYRGSSGPEPYSRMRAVEHEALMAVFAARAGVPSVDPIAAGLAGDDVAILAVRRPGTALAEQESEDVSDEALIAIWRDLLLLHDSGIAHGAPTTTNLMTVETSHVFANFSGGTLAPGDRTVHDIVELLFSLAAWAGVDRSVATARAALGDERLAATLPYLQLPALRRESRRVTAKPKALMAELKGAVVAATGVEAPEPVQLRRVTIGNVVMLGLILFAANALISQLTDIDFVAVWEVIQDAAWIPLLLAFPISHLNFFAEAGSMMAAVGKPLPLRPLAVLQIAARFIGLAVPSAAGRVAMNSAFLVKFGVKPAVAVVQGAIDGVSGFIVEALILLIALVTSDWSLELEGDVDWQLILLIALGVVIVGVVAILLVERLRRIVVPVITDAWQSLRSVLVDPTRAIRLLTNNFLGRLVLGTTLWIILRAVGVDDISIAVALTVTVATNLLAGLVPIPGGIGVAEAVMTSWLVLVGVPEAEAFAATVVYRLWTFYLPAVEGFFAMRWLERGDYL